MHLIDTHCHLQFAKLKANLDSVLDTAKSSGVSKMICVGTTLADSRQAITIAGQNEAVWASVGVHPHDALSADLTDFKELIKQPRVVAIGEIGLDYYKQYSDKSVQQQVLRQQIELGLGSGLPFIFHVRDAWADFWSIFDGYPNLIGVIHSFSASDKELEEILRRGLLVGLNGIVTFTKDESQLAAAKQVPSDRLVLETDAPFLTPAPFRSEICEPKHTRTTAEFLAKLRGEDLAELAAHTTANAQRLFNI